MGVPPGVLERIREKLPPHVEEFRVVADGWAGFVEHVEEEFVGELEECGCRCEALGGLLRYVDWEAVARRVLDELGGRLYFVVEAGGRKYYVKAETLVFALG